MRISNMKNKKIWMIIILILIMIILASIAYAEYAYINKITIEKVGDYAFKATNVHQHWVI